MSSMITTLEKLHPDLINTFLEDHRCDAIPKDVQHFLLQLQMAAEIYEYERNISRAAGMLHTRILATQNLNVDVRTCKARIYAAIDFFNVDNNVDTKIWESTYADKFEDLAKLAIASGDLRRARECYQDARECRIRAAEAAENDKNWAPIFIISPDKSPEDFKFNKKNLKAIAKKANNGFYTNFIDELPIDKDEKKRLWKDAGIEDVDYEPIDETGSL